MDKAKLDKCQDQLLVKYAFKKQRNSKRYIRVGDEVKQYVCCPILYYCIIPTILYLILFSILSLILFPHSYITNRNCWILSILGQG